MADVDRNDATSDYSICSNTGRNAKFFYLHVYIIFIYKILCTFVSDRVKSKRID